MTDELIEAMRYRIFVGSSNEELTLANAIQRNLVRYGHTVKVWNQGVFGIGKNALEALLQALDRFDAAVFVFAPSDLVRIRGREFDAVRDNVLFELGLFTGRLGRDQTFWVVPRGQTQLRIASDLLGIFPAEYVEPSDGDWLSALSVPCDQIHEALVDAARRRAGHHSPLSDAVMNTCLERLDCALRHLTSAITSSALSVAEDCVESLPGGDGFRIRLRHRRELRVTFGRVEDCRCDDLGTVIALPANEFFDDACLTDAGSALGAFVKQHFGEQVDEFKQLVAAHRSRLRPALAEREEGCFQESYGVGTSIFFDKPLQSRLRVILCAVTRQRAGEGIKAEPSYIFAGVQSISRTMNDHKLTNLHVPLLGSGHGDLADEVALLCLAFALVITPDIRRANIVVFRETPSAEPGLGPRIVRRILASAAHAC